jgi:hypothetical protein
MRLLTAQNNTANALAQKTIYSLDTELNSNLWAAECCVSEDKNSAGKKAILDHLQSWVY